MKPPLRFLSTAGLLLAVVLTPVFLRAQPGPTSDSNAVWLTRAYVTTPGQIRLVPDMASRFKALKIKYLFVNTAFLNSKGVTDVKSEQLVAFLDTLGAWEAANHYKFTVLIWLNGSLEKTNTRYLDVSNAALRNVVTAEAEKYMNPKVSDSFVAAAKRGSDGVMIDIEPAGGDPELFKNVNVLMQQIKQAAGTGKKVGFAAHKIGTLGVWQFSGVYYHYLARNVDYIASMNYNSGKKTSEDYQAWMEAQTVSVLQSVSGAAWKNDANHPAPTNGVKVFIGFSAFPTDPKNHLPGVELISCASEGTKAGLAKVDDLSRSYFEGASVYAHSDGVSDNGYAQWATDWEEFKNSWLKP
jgi:hypothetical protein